MFQCKAERTFSSSLWVCMCVCVCRCTSLSTDAHLNVCGGHRNNLFQVTFFRLWTSCLLRQGFSLHWLALNPRVYLSLLLQCWNYRCTLPYSPYVCIISGHGAWVLMLERQAHYWLNYFARTFLLLNIVPGHLYSSSTVEDILNVNVSSSWEQESRHGNRDFSKWAIVPPTYFSVYLWIPTRRAYAHQNFSEIFQTL